MLCVNEAKYAGGYKIRLSFNNGEKGTANLEKTIYNDKRPIFSRLKKESDFANFKVEHSTVVWSDELDLAPEYLFYLAFKESKDYQATFKEWGYIA
jgi:hypothetical protein